MTPQMGSLSPLVVCKSHYVVHQGVCSSSGLVPMHMAPSNDILATQNTPKRLFFLPFLVDFETLVHHLQRLFLAALFEFLPQILCDCTSYS